MDWMDWMDEHIHGFINFNQLDHEDRLFFKDSGLDRFIEISSKILAKKIGSIDAYNLNKPYFSEEALLHTNALIEDLLELIGKQSNRYIGEAVERQNEYFNEPSGRNKFPIHLNLSRWLEKRSLLIKKDKNNEEIINKNSDIRLGPFSKKAFKGIPSENKITFGYFKMNTGETRAVGVLYMISLVWKTVQEYNHQKLGKDKPQNLAIVLNAGFRLFSLLDETDRILASSLGGTIGNKTKEYSEAMQLIESLVLSERDLDTKILTIRATAQIAEQCIDEEDRPPERSVTEEIRRIKKTLRRN